MRDPTDMKRKIGKLELTRETLRGLEEQAVRQALGGYRTQLVSCFESCTCLATYTCACTFGC